MNSINGVDPKAIEADVVIVGGGAAGLPAAITAKESSANDVVLIEKRGGLGGNAAMAWGLFATESPVQKQALVEARNDELFHTIMDWAHWSIDPRIIRAFIDKSGDTISWLEKKGIRFDLLRYYPNQSPPVWHIPEGRGARLMKTLAGNCAELGVQILLNAGCKKILRGKNGNVIGVIAEREGEVIAIRAKSVIIATGGYAGNKELLKKYCEYYDDNIRCFGLPHTGDGLQMAIEIGAATESLGLLHLEWPHVHSDPEAVLATIAREPYTVYVNNKGRRFIDETKGLHAFECANAILRQPEKLGYILIDDEMRRNMEERGTVLGRGMKRAERRREIPGLEEKLRSAASKDMEVLKVSDSWDEIAHWIGADPKVLRVTIDKYNSFCAQGFDEVFAKDQRYLLSLRIPPYYAIKGELIFLQTIGGLKVNEYMEVLDQQDDPIPGLYAAGVDTGGWEPDTYCDKLSGAALGFSINSGRIAGEVAAKYISGK
ncbi:FAD-dependent oxidoreductase [Thermodesulfobacteriota bacterium]